MSIETMLNQIMLFMRKYFVMLLSLIFLATTSVGFVSCGDDDDEVVPASGGTSSGGLSTEVNVKDNTPEGVEAVDLGLPSGTKWANMNIGANSEEDYGDYYAWGEIIEKGSFSIDSYHLIREDIDYTPGTNIAGTPYDVVYMRWGEEWQMPSKLQAEELINYTTSTWTSLNGINGRLFTGKNGKSIFLPASGYFWYSTCYYQNISGNYWLSTRDDDNSSNYANNLYFFDEALYTTNGNLHHGRAIRAVRRNNNNVN